MQHIVKAALLFLAMAPAAQAVTITDSTPARAITIGKPEGDLNRVVVSPGVISMKECREALKDSAEALKENSDIIMCLPADMTHGERVIGDTPFIDLTP
ncbi:MULTISPECIES: hypothetical protein [Rhizobium/Agrobacterium group]|uniref:hypothetical protein n=1 Tax=Rhizobium/Agrobacterium group TaxID=227290 RepID=UPI0011134F97|nr:MULTISPECIES: hypothetical protein [Rhizobium/Agrobacterium group]MCF1436775.1 hypothetical protein [Allorhizobium ampelinum]MCF1464933.1 hypothetical protein [Allorhizobium ampelinum]MCF1495960.1 hypothetical protein [Allorhizobium ampelinum]MUO92140.1 hypothetical protein [Agrobacterium vitis]MUZ55464.1 hypothetical protein [Agrobacterium vitis]